MLEGIGLLVKRGKNHVSWNENPPESAADFLEDAEGAENDKGDSDSDGIASPPRINPKKAVKNSAEYEELKKKLEKLKEEERQVDRYLDYLKEQAAVFNGRHPPSREQLAFLPPGVRNVPEQMYVQFEDITNMPEYKSETVIGIRAPTGTSLEVPDPDQGMKPGERRFEMYLSSKGTEHESMGGSESKGEPINVYLVQPRADHQNRGHPEHPGSFVQENHLQPTPQRSSKSSSQEKPLEDPEGRPSSRGRPDHSYNAPPPSRSEEYGQGPSPGRSRRKGPPHGNSPPRGQSYPPADAAWGAPGPYDYGSYPHRDSRDQSDSRSSGHAYPSHSRMERGDRDEGRHSLDRGRDIFSPESGQMRPPRGRGDAFRPGPHHFQHPHEMGRTASSGGEGPPAPSPEQDHLLSMPLQSPNDPYHYPLQSPSGPGFTPPGGPRESVRAGDVQFPMPSLREGREYHEASWHPPHPKIMKPPSGGGSSRR